jgi:ribosomal protein S18 acetylase RimI-like enzyme
MKIERPKESDKIPILKILSETLSPQYMPEMRDELENVVSGEQVGFAIYDDSAVPIGYITCRKTTETFKIETLAVDRMYQRKGIGISLITRLENYLLETLKDDPIVINVITDDAVNDPVQEFYKRCGFNVSGTVENEYRLGDRQVHLCKILKRGKI